MIVAVPAATPVTVPDEETVATEVSLLDHAPPEFPFVENDVGLPVQIDWVPDKVPALGAAVTVTVLLAEAFEQPPFPVTV